MTIEATKFWYVGYSRRSGRMFYIFQADNYEKAVERLKSIQGVGDVFQLTWEKLSLLTGCIIPDIVSEEQAAYGLLSFRYKRTNVSIVN